MLTSCRAGWYYRMQVHSWVRLLTTPSPQLSVQQHLPLGKLASREKESPWLGSTVISLSYIQSVWHLK